MESAAFPSTAPFILVVDDDTEIRQLLQTYLTREGWTVALAADAREAESILTLLVPDVAVLDIMMPGETGVSFARRLRAAGNRLPLLLLSAKGELQDRIDGLEAGASDYLAKPFDPRELLLRLRNLLGGLAEPAAPPNPAIAAETFTALRIGGLRWRMPAGPLLHAEGPVPLTETEHRLLTLLAASANRLLPRAELQTEFGGAERQIDVLVARLRRKIGRHSPQDAAALQTVRGRGYRLLAQPAAPEEPDHA